MRSPSSIHSASRILPDTVKGAHHVRPPLALEILLVAALAVTHQYRAVLRDGGGAGVRVSRTPFEWSGSGSERPADGHARRHLNGTRAGDCRQRGALRC